ncbi:hypothetical protein GGTG_02659 [Gaeumannomyces tritici R3-111a-1]|uniref:Uncharacterized protein n=1 Tax=Gaeumannomyces tritici (strain R3-111a-1) TaxID=644352 RepID=J3NN01_GAET3|nr:hypothetical protein GGTG_02659 [Gaeumannomyces tritici R3-111a-1]EJT77553.1 hypothetical protein GGTG_02659 [Gaeumannomyces tritici R3-111a-1]
MVCVRRRMGPSKSAAGKAHKRGTAQFEARDNALARHESPPASCVVTHARIAAVRIERRQSSEDGWVVSRQTKTHTPPPPFSSSSALIRWR